MDIHWPKNKLITTGFFLLILGPVQSSFIDTTSPLIITENFNGEDSYFGFSLLGVNTQNIFRNVVSKLYIGAPNGSHNAAGGVDTSGFVWECNLELDKEEITCGPLPNLNYPKQECCYSPYAESRCYSPESQGMWMGGSISARAGSRDDFLTCGHRWNIKRRGGQKGLCYLRDMRQGDRISQLKPHFETRTIDANKERFKWDTSLGFSASFDANNRFLVGAPSVYFSSGAVVAYDTQRIRTTATDVNCGYRIPSAGNIITANLVSGAPYFGGYAITSGAFLNRNQQLFAVGAPRGQKDASKGFLQGYVTLVDGLVGGQVGDPIFGGEKDLGFYFGSVLASADIHGDGLDDLIVGAPMYTESMDSFEQGCVYVYTARGGRGNFGLELKLVRKGSSGSRFGSAMANLGDVNYDGIADVAISAPGADNGKGSVFIYYGGSSGLDAQRVLEIHASKIDPHLTGFGSSLYGNIDLDGNQTPDVVIGSYVSKRVVLLRTRPKATLQIDTKYSIQKFKQMDQGFIVTICIRTERTPKFDGALSITLRGQVDSRVSEGKERFHFIENDQRVIERNVKVPEAGKQCLGLSIKLVQELTPNDNKNIYFSWNLSYNDTKDLPQVASNFYITDVRLNKISGSRKFCSNCPAATSVVYEDFLPLANDNCDDDKNPICTSDLKITTSFQAPQENTAVPAVLEINEYTIGSGGPVVFVVNITNNGETAYRPTIRISTNISLLKLVGTIYRSRHDCEQKPLLSSTTFLYECAVPLHQKKTIQLELSLDFNQRPVDQYKAEVVGFTVTSQPLTVDKDSRTKSVQLKLLTDYNLSLKAFRKSPIRVDTSGKNFQFTSSFLVRNSGVTPLDGLQLSLTFKIPVRRIGQNNGPRVIKVGKPQSLKINCTTSDPQGFDELYTPSNANQRTLFNGRDHNMLPSSNHTNTNQTNVKENVAPTKKNRRSSPPIPIANAQKGSAGPGKSFEIDCGESSNWHCIKVECKPNVPLTSTELAIDLRLGFNPSTLYIPEGTDSILFKVDGSGIVEIGNGIEIGQGSLESSSISKLDLFITSELPAFLIFGSIVGGLVLLLLITFGLFKCGFFRRKVKEDLVALKARAEEQEIIAKAFPGMPTEE